jgi:hypothetical protein
MDAELTWDVWRRILKDDRLGSQVRTGAVDAAEFGLSAGEAEVAAAYAAHAPGAAWAIETYRYRSGSSALHVLSAGAPFTLRLLRQSRTDLRRLAEAFAESRGWADDGPFLYRRCAAFLTSLMESGEFRHVPGLQDMATLELAVMRLMMQCAGLPAQTWPARGQALPADPAAGWYVQTGLGVVTTTAHRLTPWLKDARLFGQAPLVPEPEHLLVCLTDLDKGHVLCALGPETARIFERVLTPCHYTDLTPSGTGQLT